MKKRYTGVLAALAAGVLIFSTGLTGEAARIGTITTDGSRVRATADAEGQKVCSLPTCRPSSLMAFMEMVELMPKNSTTE